MRTRKIALAGLACAVVAGTIGVPALTANNAPSAGNPDVPGVAALTRAATAQDNVPDELLKSEAAEHFATPVFSRFVGINNGRRYFVVKGTDNYLCLEGVQGRGPSFTSAGICNPESQLVTAGAIWIAGFDQPGSPVTIAAIVPDGYSMATAGSESVAVSNNFFVVDLPPGQTSSVTVSGQDVPVRTIDTGAPTTESRIP